MLLSDDALESDARVHKEARTLVRNGYSVTVFVWNRKGVSEGRKEFDGIKIERIPLKVPFSETRGILFFYILLFNLKTFLRLLRSSFDLVHCHDLDTLFAGLIAGKIKGKKVIYDAHEIYGLMIQPYTSKMIVKILSSVEFLLIKKTDALITVSELFSSYFKLGVGDNVEIFVIMNCKDSGDFEKSKKEIEELKIRFGVSNRFIILYDGWLTPDNGLEDLFVGIEKLNHQIRDLMVIICGDGYCEKEFKRLVKEKNIENYVKFIGKIHSRDIPLLVNACDIMYVVYKPTNKYSFFRTPVRLFEAIIAGKPVIAGNLGNIKQIVEKGGFGLLVNYGKTDDLCDALLKLKYDIRLRNDLGEKAKNMAKTYNWFLMEEKLLKLYEHL
jgi:glycosyltransferase involved in cell wall biosynthesis